jgi:hypothetical protein
MISGPLEIVKHAASGLPRPDLKGVWHIDRVFRRSGESGIDLIHKLSESGCVKRFLAGSANL